MNFERILLYMISFIVIYRMFFITEKLTNDDITAKISEIYKADVGAIRNLSKLANDLTKNGKLVIPGELEIKGNVRIGDGKIDLTSDGRVISQTLESNTLNNYVKKDTNYYIYQTSGHNPNKYLHGHNNSRVGVAGSQYKTTFQIKSS